MSRNKCFPIPSAKVSVGHPPLSSSLGLHGNEWKSSQFHIHYFASLATEKNHCVPLPLFNCNGAQWQLLFFPGGQADADEGYATVNLCHLFEGNIKYQDNFSH